MTLTALLTSPRFETSAMNPLDQDSANVTGVIEPKRFRARPSIPLFVADWLEVLFLHFEVEAGRLQPFVPFALDLWDGRAFVSLVTFTMRGLRFARLGALGAWICKPIATHAFLNLRTYVCHGDEAGICFLSEWLPNRLSILFGPLLYALPYRRASICCRRMGARLSGCVTTRGGGLRYEGTLSGESFSACEESSLDQFLLERYTAFNAGHFTAAKLNVARPLFRVTHKPWRQAPAAVLIADDALLRVTAPWWQHVHFVGANYSPGVRDVGMTAPKAIH